MTGFIQALFIGLIFTLSSIPSVYASGPSTDIVTEQQARAIFQQGYECRPPHSKPSCGNIQRGRLRLLADIPVQHYCVDDWHMAGALDAEDATVGGGVQGVLDKLNSFNLTVSIDDQSLDLDRTSNRRIPNDVAMEDGFTPPAFWVDMGTVLSPSALSVGEHHSHVEAFYDTTLIIAVDRTFVIDPSGEGACLQ